MSPVSQRCVTCGDFVRRRPVLGAACRTRPARAAQNAEGHVEGSPAGRAFQRGHLFRLLRYGTAVELRSAGEARRVCSRARLGLPHSSSADLGRKAIARLHGAASVLNCDDGVSPPRHCSPGRTGSVGYGEFLDPCADDCVDVVGGRGDGNGMLGSAGVKRARDSGAEPCLRGALDPKPDDEHPGSVGRCGFHAWMVAQSCHGPVTGSGPPAALSSPGRAQY
jgi:hypothetical protein